MQTPSALTLREPLLLDMLGICLALPAENRAEYRAIGGREFDPEEAAVSMWTTGELRWCMADSNGRPVVVCGYTRLVPGVLRSWLFAAPSAWSEYAADVTQFARDIVNGLLEQGVARRLETLTLASRTHAREWLSSIGLVHEATFKGFGAGGEDAVLYVATRNEGNTGVFH